MAPLSFRRFGSHRYSLRRQQATSPDGIISSIKALIAVTQSGCNAVETSSRKLAPRCEVSVCERHPPNIPLLYVEEFRVGRFGLYWAERAKGGRSLGSKDTLLDEAMSSLPGIKGSIAAGFW